MKSNRLEAFSDGVIAIIITIMVLDLKAPHEPNLESVLKVLPTLLTYVLSFIIVAIYWVNHHHLLHLVTKVDAGILWANINLLFWMSLFPWVTSYLGENHAASLAVSAYAFVAFASGASFNILRRTIARHNQDNESLRSLHARRNRLSIIALSFYFSAIFTAWFYVPLALISIAAPMMIYFFPDLIFPDHKILNNE
jgi:uncharacterized membrane protein